MKSTLDVMAGIAFGFVILVIVAIAIFPFGGCICDTPGKTHWKELVFLCGGATGSIAWIKVKDLIFHRIKHASTKEN
jgi:hypothetical protein